MRSTLRLLILTMPLPLAGTLAEPAEAAARALQAHPTLWLDCENGGRYAVRPIAISDEGDLVTGRLILGRNQGIHVRLIPMGGGYRYAGRGIWFDGWRESVYLYRSKYRPIACTVVGGPEQARN